MYESNNREVRRLKFKGEPYHVYYSPEIAVRAHDHNYVLRLLSDKMAKRQPDQFTLLPHFRSVAIR